MDRQNNVMNKRCEVYTNVTATQRKKQTKNSVTRYKQLQYYRLKDRVKRDDKVPYLGYN